MDAVIIAAITFGYLILVLFVGLAARRRQTSSLESYVAGGRHVGLVILFFIMGAEVFSAFAFLGAPGWAYSKGAPVFYIMAYLTLGIGFWWLLGPKVSRLGRRYGYLTQADLLVDRFPSKPLGLFIAIVSVLALIPYLTIQIAGAGLLFQAATEGAIPFWLGALLAFAVVTLYVYTSGLGGIGWTNLMQGILMMAVAWFLGLAVADRFYGGVGSMFERIVHEAPEYLTLPGARGMSWGAFSTAILVSAFGSIMWPHLFTKFYSARSERTLKQVFILYPLYAWLLIPIMIIGFAGILVLRDSPLDRPDDVLLKLVIEMADFPPWLIGIMLSGALAAAMSTGANLAHTAATVLVRDFLHPLGLAGTGDERTIALIKRSVVGISLVSYIVALFNPASLVSLLLGAYGIIVQLLPLVIGALFWRRATTAGAWVGLAVGAILTLLFQFVIASPLGWHAGFWGLLANTICFIAISRATWRQAARDLQPDFVDEGEPVVRAS